MGSLFSAVASFIQTEKRTWANHSIEYDHSCRISMLAELERFKVGQKVHLAYVRCKHLNFPFQHWFITNEKDFFEFGSPNLSIYDARVWIKNSYEAPRQYTIKTTVVLDEAMKYRMALLAGMKNYSLCFRNCEHVAYFVITGRWFCSQMQEPPTQRSGPTFSNLGHLKHAFRNYLMGDDLRRINTAPQQIQLTLYNVEGGARQVYPFLPNPVARFTNVNFYLDNNEDVKTYLLIGASGVGKSHLINAFFNLDVCQESSDMGSTTRDVIFIHGEQTILLEASNGEVTRCQQKVVLIDTIGFCDSEYNDQELEVFIKSRVSSNVKKLDGVMVLLKSLDKLSEGLAQNLKSILKWLKYDRSHPQNLCFIFTHADLMQPNQHDGSVESQKERKELYVKKTFELAEEADKAPGLIQFTSFPPNVNDHDRFIQMYADTFTPFFRTNGGGFRVPQPFSCRIM